MVRVRRPDTPMTSTPPSYDEWEEVQQDALPLRDPMEALREIEAASNKQRSNKDGGSWSIEAGKQFWDATVDLQSRVKDLAGKVSVAQAVRMTTRGCSIKFVAVIGLTGAGKSSVIKALTGEDVHVEHSIHTGTTTFAMFPTIIDEQRYVLIDTPGFNDQERTDMDVFQEILDWFHTMTPYCDLDGILYVHDITPKRFSKSAKLNLDMLEALCGEKFFKKVTILTTMWGNMNAPAVRAAEKRQVQFEQGPWKKLIDGGARVFRHLDGVAEPEDSVNGKEKEELEKQREKARLELEGIIAYYKTSERVTPRIQKELRRKVEILSTAAGDVLRKGYNLPPTLNQMDSNGNTAPNSPNCRTDDNSTVPQSPPSPATTANSVYDIPTPPEIPEKPKNSKEGAGEGPPPTSPWFMRLIMAVTWFFGRN